MPGCAPENKVARHAERAGKFFSAGDYEKAAVECRSILQLDPENVQALEQMGTMWLERGAPLRAVPFLARAKGRASSNYVARTNLASAFLALGKVDDARKETLSILGQSATRGGALVLLTETVRTKDDYDTAMKALRSFSQQDTPEYQIASANLLLAKGNLDAAKKGLQRALENWPKQPELHSAMATVCLRANDPTRAEEALNLAAELSPRRSAARMRVAEYKVQTGKVREGMTYLVELVRLAPDFLSPRRLLAQILLSEKKYDEAQTLLREILIQDPLNVEAPLLQSQVLMAKRELKQAVEVLEQLNKANPGLAVINYHLAQAHLQNNNPAQAASVLRAGLAADPERADLKLLLAETSLRTGDAEPVIGLMSHLLQRHPDMVQAQLLLINALRQLGKLDDAGTIARDQIRAYPKSPQPHVLLGGILRQQGKPPEALQSFARALAVAPGYLPALSEAVDLEIEGRTFESALQRVESFLRETPSAAGAYFLQGKIHVAQGNWDSAEVALQKSLEKDPTFYAAYDLLLHTYVSNRRLPQAIAQLEGVLARNPADERALALCGMIYEQMNETAKAKNAYEKLVAVKPDALLALNNLANQCAEQPNELDRAYELATKARALAPDSAPIADTLGWIHFKRREYPQALSLLVESAAKLPGNPEVLFHLGMARRMAGQTEAALQALRIAVASPLNFRGKDEAKRQLASLEKP